LPHPVTALPVPAPGCMSVSVCRRVSKSTRSTLPHSPKGGATPAGLGRARITPQDSTAPSLMIPKVSRLKRSSARHCLHLEFGRAIARLTLAIGLGV
jgi:hypothetical protein